MKEIIEKKLKAVNKQIKKVEENIKNQFGYIVFNKNNEKELYTLLRLEGKKTILMELKKEALKIK